MLKKYGWMFVIPGLILFSLAVFILWQRDQLENVKLDPSEGRKIRSELFLRNQGSTAPSAASKAGGSNANATAPEPPLPWRDPRIPEFPLLTQSYSSLIGRARTLLNAQLAPSDQSDMRPMLELEEAFAQEVRLDDGRLMMRMFDKRSGELMSERWSDPELGQIIRSYQPEIQTVSLSARSPGRQIDLVSNPVDGVEYATVKEADKGFVSIDEGGRRSEYWADLKQNRFLEYQDGRTRQWLRIGENRFQEIDDSGRRLSVYRVDPESREIVLAE